MAENGQDPQEGQEGAPPPEQEAPQQPEGEARQYDYDPDLVRSQYEEVKRREREVERRERDMHQKLRESERQPRYPDPSMDMLDPVQRAVLDRLERMDQRLSQREEREEQRAQAEADFNRTTGELQSAFENEAKRAGKSDEWIQQNSDRMAHVIMDTYGSVNYIRESGLGAERATRAAFKLLNGNGGRNYQPPQTITTRVTPRTPVITSQGSGPIEDRADTGPQRQGESNTDYAQRVLRNFESLGLKGMSLRDGDKISSE